MYMHYLRMFLSFKNNIFKCFCVKIANPFCSATSVTVLMPHLCTIIMSALMHFEEIQMEVDIQQYDIEASTMIPYPRNKRLLLLDVS